MAWNTAEGQDRPSGPRGRAAGGLGRPGASLLVRGRPGGGMVAVAAGWVLPALLLLLGGGASLLVLTWRRASAGTAPNLLAFDLVALLIAAADFGVAVNFELSAMRRSDLWRPLLGVALSLGAVGVALTAHHRVFLVAAVSAVLLAFLARAAETLGKWLAPVLRLSADYQGGDWPTQSPETRRIVLETWVCCAGAAALARVGWGSAPALGAMVAGGLALAIGAKLNSAQRAAAQEGYDWPAADLARAWRGAGLVAALPLALGLLVPGLPRLASVRFLLLPVSVFMWATGLGSAGQSRPSRPAGGGGSPPGWLTRLHLRGGPAVAHRIAATTGAGNGGATPVPGGERANLFGRGGALLLFLRQELLLLVAALLVILVLIQFLRYAFDPDVHGWREALARLWDSLATMLSFWRWFGGWGGLFAEERLGRRGREGPAANAAVGRPAPAAPGLLRGLMDPRRVIRASYRRYLRGAAAAGQPRQAAESPAVYAARMTPLLRTEASQVSELTQAYEEARFSVHPLDRGWLPGVRAALDRLLAAVRSRPWRRGGSAAGNEGDGR